MNLQGKRDLLEKGLAHLRQEIATAKNALRELEMAEQRQLGALQLVQVLESQGGEVAEPVDPVVDAAVDEG